MNSNEIPIPTVTDATQEDFDPGLREELISLAEAGDIKHTSKYIKKASQAVLEKIKEDHDRKQINEANEFISNNIISKFSELMNSLNMIGRSDEMEKELQDNKLLRRDLKNIIGHITPYIPMIGLLCGGVIAAKHIVGNRHTPDVHEDGAVGNPAWNAPATEGIRQDERQQP